MSSNKILVLGSGMVARPCVDYLARNPVNQITVGMDMQRDFASLLLQCSLSRMR